MSGSEAPGVPVRVRLARGVEMEFRWIPAGDFVMGSRGEHRDEEPRHRVRIGRGFYLGTYPVTQAQFRAWTSQPPDELHGNYFKGLHENYLEGRPQHPASGINWHDALAFCGWLNDARRLVTRDGERVSAGFLAALPTDAECEYACRAGTETEYYFGDGEAALDQAGWYNGNSRRRTHPVGEKEPNGFGLCDMHGSVDEWCWDAYDADAYTNRADGVIDPGARERDAWLRGGRESIPVVDGPRVSRGGSWNSTAWDCRSACRGRAWPEGRSWEGGFRVCLVPGPPNGQRGATELEPGRPAPKASARRAATRAEQEVAGTSPGSDLEARRSRRGDGRDANGSR